MKSDYEWITRENVRDRGEKFDDIGVFFSEQFYPDQTHFIYELLQNAQDALKKRSRIDSNNPINKCVSFNLTENSLELRHFGQPFDTADVRAISNILIGTKIGENSQIGRFGIGFKSVYAFTKSPEIYSGDEHFCIERYIRLKEIDPYPLKKGETLFVFPFNHDGKTQGDSFSMIKHRLSDLGVRTLLFLGEIDTIEWSINGKTQGTYLRESELFKNGSNIITLLGQDGNESIEERWLVFNKYVEPANSNVQIAFLLETDKKSKKEFIQPIPPSNLYAYFETAKMTQLHFLIQGHYRTTPSRDNVQENDETNKSLIDATSMLLTEALVALRDMNLLTAELLNALPLNEDHFPKSSFFRPIYEGLFETFQKERLLPTSNDNYANSSEVKLARGSGLIQLLSPDMLRELFASGSNCQWLSDDITIDKTPNFRDYLLKKLDVDEIDPERFANQITNSFLFLQSDEWLIKFYKFLDVNSALWRQKRYYSDHDGVLRNKQIIRLENGNMSSPFDDQGNCQVYLPSEIDTDFPIVRRTIAEDKDVLKFLKSMGLEEPDIVAEVISHVLPKYDADNSLSITDEEHFVHLKKISNALNQATGIKKDNLFDKLQNTCFLRGIQPGNSTRYFVSPGQLYIDDEILRDYYEGNPDVWFYDPAYYQYMDLLDDLEVERKIHMEHNPRKSEFVALCSWPHIRGIKGFDPDWNVDGLSFAVQNPTLVRSKIIWDEILRPNKHLIRGEIETSTRQDYVRSEKEKKLSIAGELITQNAWLPDKEGTFHLPSELSLDDLPDDYFRDEELSNQLGMKGITATAFAKENQIDETLLNLGLEAMRSAPELFMELVHQILHRGVEQVSPSKFNFISDLEDKINKPFSISDEDASDEFSANPIPDPKRRREKEQEDILNGILSEPENNLRFKIVSTRIMGAKDKQVRGFLYEEYHGKCQICGNTFKKRDGYPYFEGLYLVSRINGQWVDRIGNVLCLCADCCAKFQYGPLTIENLREQIIGIKMKNEGGTDRPGIIIDLCGDQQEIHYSERHMLDLQEIIKLSMS